MLYISTRSSETYTAARTLTADNAPDGGLFVPFQMPKLTLDDLCGKTQAECIALVLNLFFRAKLSGADVKNAMGADAISLRPIDRKVTVIQGWNRVYPEFSRVKYALYKLLCQDVPACRNTTQWPKIAITIAFFAAIIAENAENREVDIAVNAGDFLTPMALYYCRQMGLPVGKILCAVNENSGLWDFFTHGQLSCGAAVISTDLPHLDVALPAQLERLIFADQGIDGATEFSQRSADGKLYKVDADTLSRISDRFAVSVVSAQRVPSTIHRIYTTNAYVLDTYGALTFGALQDYRASSGDIRHTLLFSAYSPMVHRSAVAGALNIPEYKLSELL